MKQYRIGDYAKYLGVSPDFLKHYEEQGLITPSRSGSGYRYYSFTTTMRLIECVRLRNYGMTLREIREILTEHAESNEQVERRVAENVRSLEQEVTLVADANVETEVVVRLQVVDNLLSEMVDVHDDTFEASRFQAEDDVVE